VIKLNNIKNSKHIANKFDVIVVNGIIVRNRFGKVN
jgi:hypothetical protein